MTSEIKSLTPKELKKLQEALSIVSKVYHITDKEIDEALTYVHLFGNLFKTIELMQQDISALSEDKEKKSLQKERELIEEARKELLTQPSFMDLSNV